MNAKEILRHVAVQAPPSVGREILTLWTSGQTSTEDYYNQNAVLVADTLNSYAPKIILSLPAHLKAYVDGRLMNTKPYDYTSAKPLGEWFFETMKAIDSNAADLSLLLWSQERLRGVGLTAQVEKVQKQIERFAAFIPPYALIEQIMRVKALDAEARERAKR